MKGMYLMSRSNAYESEIKEIISKILSIRQKIDNLKNNRDLYILINSLKNKKFETKPKEPLNISEAKIKKVKKFLFESYEQCISRKISSPTYMSKEAIIKYIKENDPNLLKFLPKNIQSMKKEEICKVIFQ